MDFQCRFCVVRLRNWAMPHALIAERFYIVRISMSIIVQHLPNCDRPTCCYVLIIPLSPRLMDVVRLVL